MKKLILSFIIAILGSTVTFAQSTLVATLTHGTDITMYYGNTALQSAHNAAQSGDVINLSGGTFNSINITKAVTIQGTGIDNAIPSIIKNNFTITIPSEETNRFSMEGVICDGMITMNGTWENPLFIKSKISEIYQQTSIKNATFVNCKITKSCKVNGTSSASFFNSFVYFSANGAVSSSSQAAFYNCVIAFRDAYSSGHKGSITSVNNCQFLDSIIEEGSFSFSNNKNQRLPTTCSGFNCIAVNFSDPFADGQGTFVNCQSNLTYDSIFKNYTGTYSDTQTFELTDEAKADYTGIDGKEVGIYGGDYPYNSIPSYPQITKMDVSKKTTADGKLNVEIEVSAAE